MMMVMLSFEILLAPGAFKFSIPLLFLASAQFSYHFVSFFWGEFEVSLIAGEVSVCMCIALVSYQITLVF
jgi:hypothetical protein